MSDRPGILFIVGLGRSGTSLLQAMLDTHSQISFLPENHLFLECVIPEHHRRLTLSGADTIMRFLSTRTRVDRLENINIAELVRSTEAEPASSFFRRLFFRLVEAYGLATRKPIVGDKNPRYTGHLATIAEIVPDAVVVHIIRDIRDSILSATRTAWGKRMSFLRHVFYAKQELSSAREAVKSLPCRYISVHYEELVTRPESVLADLCRNLGVAYEPEMLMYFVTARRIVGDDELEWKRNVLRPVTPERIGKWRTELSPVRLLILEGLLHRELVAYGYSPRYAGSCLLWLASCLLGGCYALYRLLQTATGKLTRRTVSFHRTPRCS
jgi:hypothetical protein